MLIFNKGPNNVLRSGAHDRVSCIYFPPANPRTYRTTVTLRRSYVCPMHASRWNKGPTYFHCRWLFARMEEEGDGGKENDVEEMEEKPRESYEPMKMTMPRGHTSDVFHRLTPSYYSVLHSFPPPDLPPASFVFSLKASFVIIGRGRASEKKRQTREMIGPSRFVQYPEYWGLTRGRMKGEGTETSRKRDRIIISKDGEHTEDRRR